jgi:glycerol-3-phosphate dehydrogenase
MSSALRGDANSSNFKQTADSVSRSATLFSMANAGVYDLVVVGGGIHGAAVARLAAGYGLKTALLEKNDYAGATSSRSSKMAHGGLRYLELLDFEQVFEGIKAREEMFDHVGNLVKPAEFLIPVATGAWFFKLKLGIGLFLYDLMVKKGNRRHRWIPRAKLNFPGFHSGREDLMGCFVYTDGIMSDARLVIDNVIGARRYGADCLNYCEVRSMKRSESGVSEVTAIDTTSGKEIALKARLVVNCAGPWASTLASSLGAEARPLKFSRGSHIIFNKPWTGPSLFLPMPGKARYYFVWPHPAGTMVGTTEREVSRVELDPLPSKDEIEEIFGRLEKDIPDAGLTRDNACYAFAGIRTLPIRGKNANSTVLSRKHIWTHENGVLTLLGGKYTTASWTALEGVKEAAQILGKPLSSDVVKSRVDLKELPGSTSEVECEELQRSLSTHGVSPEAQNRLLGRYGKRLGDNYLEFVDPSPEKLIELETMIALDTEQVESLEDLMRRRLELEYTDGHGEKYLPIIGEVFKRMRPDIDFEREKTQYLDRMKIVRSLLGKAS